MTKKRSRGGLIEKLREELDDTKRQLGEVENELSELRNPVESAEPVETFDDLRPRAALVFENQPGVEVNAIGGRQSAIGVRMDLMDSRALLRLGRVLEEGAKKYTPNNWRKIDRASHLNHALHHIFESLDPNIHTNCREEALDHAFCRVMMAIATE